jgi:hypothetical protein
VLAISQELSMAEITAGMVKELREKTDAPMMECKKALTEASGDLTKAEEILRVRLGNKASKAASRVTAEGVVGTFIAPSPSAPPLTAPPALLNSLLRWVRRARDAGMSGEQIRTLVEAALDEDAGAKAPSEPAGGVA